MTKDQYGVWEIVLPPKEPGVCAIPHDSKIKVRIEHASGKSASNADVV